MANKNTKNLRRLVKKACKAGQAFVDWQTPVSDYFNYDGIQLRTVRVPTAIVRGDGVNSFNSRRNSCQRIYLNKDENGRTVRVSYGCPTVTPERKHDER